MKYWIFFLFLFPFYIACQEMDKFQIQLSVDHDQITLGKPVTLFATIKYPESYSIDTDALINRLLWTANPTAPQFILKEQVISSDQRNIKLILEPLQVGSSFITFLNVDFKPLKEELPPATFPSEVIEIEVLPAPPMAAMTLADLHGLASELPLGLTSSNRFDLVDSEGVQQKEARRNVNIIRLHSFPWIEVFWLILASLAVWGLKVFRDNLEKQRRAKMKANAAFLQADKNLDQLESKKLYEQKRYKDYFIEIKKIILTFLEQGHHINWQSYTTHEIAQIPSTNSKEFFLKNKLIAFFNKADQVEFAGYIPSDAECQEAFKTAQSLLIDRQQG